MIVSKALPDDLRRHYGSHDTSADISVGDNEHSPA